ncbi:hypothetical protein DBR17_11260, partial [Sphingomonas sp. HMWF008]
DYYRHTAFEFVTDRLGAQGTVLAGGRYDGLIGSLGGPETAGVGWAAGIERLAMLLEEPSSESVDVVVVPADTSAIKTTTALVSKLRRLGFVCDMAFRGNMKRRLARADAQGAFLAIIVGAAEIEKQSFQLKILRSGGQLELPQGAFFKILQSVREQAWELNKGADIQTMLTDALTVGIDE